MTQTPPNPGWQPIETAPSVSDFDNNDPAWVLATAGKVPWVAARDDEGWHSFNLHYEGDARRAKRDDPTFRPTHWMPLPTPPETQAETNAITKAQSLAGGEG